MSEPFRILFPLAVVGGISGVVHWIFFAMGRPTAGASLHIAFQIPAYLGIAAGGFLATAIPRFTRTEGATRVEFAALLVFSLGLLVAPITRSLSPSVEIFACYLLFLAHFAWRRIRRAGGSVPPTLRWVFVAAGLAVAGAVALRPAPVLSVSLLSQGFVFPLILGVAPFVGRRILGGADAPACIHAAKGGPPRLFPVVAGVFAATFPLEALGGDAAQRTAYLLRGGILLLVFAKAGLLAPPRPFHPQAAGFWISVLLTAAGPFAVAIDPAHRIAWLHLSFLGGFSLMFLMVATRVTLAHCGRGDLLARSYRPTGFACAAILAATAARLGADFFPERYFLGIGAAAVLWILAHATLGSCLYLSVRSEGWDTAPA